MKKMIVAILFMLAFFMSATQEVKAMPVFGDTPYKNAYKPPTTSSVPAWMANEQMRYSKPASQSFTPGYGQTNPTSSTGTQRRERGSPELGVALQRPPDPLLNTPMSGPGSTRRMYGTPVLGASLQTPQVQTYVADPKTYSSQQTPYWQQPAQAPSWLRQSKPYPLYNTQSEEPLEYDPSTGTAGQPNIPYRNSYNMLPPMPQLPPMGDQPTSPFSSYYGWGRGRGYGGGGYGGYGGYSKSNYTPAWMMGLNSWNFNE
jgi:hypothetical protein